MTYIQPIILTVAGQPEILSQIVAFLTLSEVAKLFPVIQQRQPQRDVVVRTTLTFRPKELLLKEIIKRGLVRQDDEKINFSESIFKSLLIPSIAYGVTWETMCNLYRLVQSIPLDCNGTKEKFRLKTVGTRIRIGRSSARFKNYGMKIALPYHRCHVYGCDKIVFRRNNCLNVFHRFSMAYHCSLEEEDEGLCWDCGGELSFCDRCDDEYCLECGGDYCEDCEVFFCSHCECNCEEEKEEEFGLID